MRDAPLRPLELRKLNANLTGLIPITHRTARLRSPVSSRPGHQGSTASGWGTGQERMDANASNNHGEHFAAHPPSFDNSKNPKG
ncbi:hypothetical protein VTO42DRAFT_4485 [Malbranchea cinnamomea]